MPVMKIENRIKALIQQSTTIDNISKEEYFDKEKFAELIVAECIAAVLSPEVSLSSYMASLIEDRTGYPYNYFNNDWYKNNYQLPENE